MKAHLFTRSFLVMAACAVLMTVTGEASAKTAAKSKKRETKTTVVDTEVVTKKEESQSNKLILENGKPSGGAMDVTAYLGSYDFLGIEYGVMGAVRILPEGFIKTLNNSVAVELGAHRSTWDVGWYDHDRFSFTADMRWEFHVHPQWSPYGTFGLGYEKDDKDSTSYYYSSDSSDSRMFIEVKAGTFLHLSKSWAVRFEYSITQVALRTGMTYIF